MAKATSVVDVILGEAVHGTRADRYEDMLGIASVIDNRSVRGNVPAEQIVANKNEFNAYDKSLPNGVENYRDLAEQAWAQVQAFGPVHNGVFYATEAAKNNLPKGLEQVATTKGHVYYDDPQNRSFAIQGGQFVTPAPERQALAEVNNPLLNTDLPGLAMPEVPVSAYAPSLTTPAQFAFSDILPPTPVQTTSIDPTAVSLPSIAPTPTVASSVPSVPSTSGLGMAALAPNGLVGDSRYGAVDYAHPERGDWSRGMTPDAIESVQMMAAMSPVGIGITSATRSPSVNAGAGGARQSQHMVGNAYDMDLSGLTDAERSLAVEQARMSGATRLGAYSAPNLQDMMHVDFAPGWTMANPVNPEGTYAMMDKSQFNMDNAPGWFTQGLTQVTVPTPTSRDEALASLEVPEMAGFSAPVGAVERSPLDDIYTAPVEAVERASLPDITPSVPEAVMSDYASTLSVPGFDFSVPTEPTQVASLAPASVESVERSSLPDIAPAPTVPSTTDIANAYGQLASTMGQAGVTGLGAVPSTTPSVPSATFASLPNELTAPANTFQSSVPAPVSTPAPVATPAPTVPSTPTVTAPSVNSAPSVPGTKTEDKGTSLGSRLGHAAIGGAIGGIPGAVIGGLFGPAITSTAKSALGSVGKGLGLGDAKGIGLGGLFDTNVQMPESTFSVGRGVDAIDGVFSGQFGVGATAFSTGNPAVSFTSLGNGMVAKTNSELGTTSIVNASSFGWNGGTGKSSTPSTSTASGSWGLGDVFGGLGDAISDAFSGFGDWGGDWSGSSANDHSYSE